VSRQQQEEEEEGGGQSQWLGGGVQFKLNLGRERSVSRGLFACSVSVSLCSLLFVVRCVAMYKS
jgi:hypothetical protein